MDVTTIVQPCLLQSFNQAWFAVVRHLRLLHFRCCRGLLLQLRFGRLEQGSQQGLPMRWRIPLALIHLCLSVLLSLRCLLSLLLLSLNTWFVPPSPQ